MVSTSSLITANLLRTPNSSDFDRKYFTDYLRMFIFNDSIFNRDMAPDFTSTRENSIVDLISKSAPNILYGIIGFLSEEEQVKFMESFLGTVILDMDMDRVTVNNLFLRQEYCENYY